LVLCIYCIINPAWNTPDWCYNYFANLNEYHFSYDCKLVDNNTIKYSNFLKLSPYFTEAVDIVCLCFFLFFEAYKNSWSRAKKARKIEFAVLCLIVAICLISSFLGMLSLSRSIISSFFRPIIALFFTRKVRENIFLVMQDIKATFIVWVTIFAFVSFYSVVGFFLF